MSKLTWSDQQNEIMETTGLNDAANLKIFKRDMNTGATLLVKKLGREYGRHSRFTDLVNEQQYYQMPEDAHRLKDLMVNWGVYNPPMRQIPDETAWRRLNAFPRTGLPTCYFIRGYKEFGLYPTPSLNVAQGVELVFSPTHTNTTEDDYTTGTVTVTNGSINVTLANGTFTSKMANLGQWFQVTDGSDENFYKIASYVSPTAITLENVYQGEGGSNKTFRVGQVMDNLPDEYLESPVDYAAFRFYSKRGVIGLQQAQYFQGLWEGALADAKDEYGQSTDNQAVTADDRLEGELYNPFRGDALPPNSVTS